MSTENRVHLEVDQYSRIGIKDVISMLKGLRSEAIIKIVQASELTGNAQDSTIDYEKNSKSQSKNSTQDSFEKSSDIQKKIFFTSNYGYGRDKLNIVNLEYHKYPMDSVPVKVVLGKIEKIENPYLPKLHLAFLESE